MDKHCDTCASKIKQICTALFCVFAMACILTSLYKISSYGGNIKQNRKRSLADIVIPEEYGNRLGKKDANENLINSKEEFSKELEKKEGTLAEIRKASNIGEEVSDASGTQENTIEQTNKTNGTEAETRPTYYSARANFKNLAPFLNLDEDAKTMVPFFNSVTKNKIIAPLVKKTPTMAAKTEVVQTSLDTPNQSTAVDFSGDKPKSELDNKFGKQQKQGFPPSGSNTDTEESMPVSKHNIKALLEEDKSQQVSDAHLQNESHTEESHNTWHQQITNTDINKSTLVASPTSSLETAIPIVDSNGKFLQQHHQQQAVTSKQMKTNNTRSHHEIPEEDEVDDEESDNVDDGSSIADSVSDETSSTMTDIKQRLDVTRKNIKSLEKSLDLERDRASAINYGHDESNGNNLTNYSNFDSENPYSSNKKPILTLIERETEKPSNEIMSQFNPIHKENKKEESVQVVFPQFPENYHATGLLLLPHSGIAEPFEIWFAPSVHKSRIDYYYGEYSFIFYLSFLVFVFQICRS